MTHRERAMLGAAVTNAKALERAAELRRLLAEGEGIKRAAHRAGMAERTARRHRREWQA